VVSQVWQAWQAGSQVAGGGTIGAAPAAVVIAAGGQ